MSLFNLISNTVEGVAQAAVGTAKSGVGVVISPLDGGHTLEKGLENLCEGVDKVGDSSKE